MIQEEGVLLKGPKIGNAVYKFKGYDFQEEKDIAENLRTVKPT